MLHLIPERYHHMVNSNKWKNNLIDIINLLVVKYPIIGIVPACAKEMVKMSADDLLITNLSKASSEMVSIHTIKRIKSFKKENGEMAIRYDTAFQNAIVEKEIYEANKEIQGFHLISDTKGERISSELFKEPNEYQETFIVKLEGLVQKIKIDEKALMFMRKNLCFDDYQQMLQYVNVKKIKSII